MKKTIQPFIIITLLSVFSLTSCTNYGKKVKKEHIEVFYKDGISMEDAQKTADFLYQADANKGTAPKKSFQLTGGIDTVNFRMVVDKVKMAAVDADTWYMMGNYFSENVFKGKPVNVELTNDRFKTISTYHYKKMDLNEPAPADSTQ